MRSVDILSDKGVRAAMKRAAASGEVVVINDGAGLTLEAQPSGSAWWRLRYYRQGRANRLSLGVFPEITLAMARQRRDDIRRDVALGLDPSEKRKTAKAAHERRVEDKRRADVGLPALGSFEAVAREWLADMHGAKVSPGHSERTRIRLEQDLFPWIGRRPIGEITPPELLECLRRVEARGAIETAHRIRQVAGMVFRYGVATGACERDSAADLRDALRPVPLRHFGAIVEPKALGELLRATAEYKGHPVTRAALALAPLVFLRPGELRQIRWEWVNVEEKVIVLPATLMKRSLAGKADGAPHIVPLARQALAVIEGLRPITGSGHYLFPSLTTSTRPMSENTVRSALLRLGFDSDTHTGHGYRATARTMIVERLGIDEAVVEAQLAHVPAGPLGKAYNRAEFVAQRRQMMQAWADYLDRLRDGGEVVQLKPARRATRKAS